MAKRSVILKFRGKTGEAELEQLETAIGERVGAIVKEHGPGVADDIAAVARASGSDVGFVECVDVPESCRADVEAAMRDALTKSGRTIFDSAD